MSSLQQKITCHAKQNTTHTQRKKAGNRNCPKRAQMLDFINKDSEVATINIFKDLKETRLKEVKEGVIQCLTKQTLLRKNRMPEN